MDHIGSVNTAIINNEYIITVVDVSTRFIVTRAAPGKSASHAIQFEDDIVCKFGTPNSLITDNDTVLASNLVQ